MKKALFILMLLMILGIVFSYAQCDNKKLITSTKTEYLDANGTVQRSVDEPGTIEFTKTAITISHGMENEQMTGTIKSDSCNWKVPYKEGKTVLKIELTNPNGQVMNLTITIEGKEGKISFIAEAEGMPDRVIRLTVDKFEEKK